MRKWKFFAFLTILAFAGIVSGGPAMAEAGKYSLTLDQALEVAIKNNYLVELNKLSVDKAKLKLEQDEYNAKKMDEDNITSYQNALLKYVQPQAGKMALVIAEAQARLSDDSLKLEVEAGYYDLLKKQAGLYNAQNALDRAKEQLRIARESFKAGILAKNDVVAAEVLVASKEAAVFNAQNAYDKAKMRLADSLGLPLDAQVEPASKFSFWPVSIDLAEEVEKGLQNDLEVIAAREAITVAETTYEQVKRFYTPNVFMYREAQYKLEEAKVNLKQKEQETELKIRQAYLDMQSAEKAYKTLEASLASAEETYRVAKLKFKAGVITRMEMEKAADNLSEQEAKVTEMLFNYNLAAAQFRYGLFMDRSADGTEMLDSAAMFSDSLN